MAPVKTPARPTPDYRKALEPDGAPLRSPWDLDPESEARRQELAARRAAARRRARFGRWTALAILALLVTDAALTVAWREPLSGVAVALFAGAPDRHSGGSRPAPAGMYLPDTKPGRGTQADVYSATTSGRISPAAARFPERVYVPNNDSNSVTVINPKTFETIRTFGVGALPQHVTPSWDLRRLYAGNNEGNSLTVIDPKTARPRRTIPVADPYNLYFTPDGKLAIVVAERESRLDLRDPKTWKLIRSIPIPFSGVDHLDFSARGDYLLASAEFSGHVIRVDLRKQKLTGDAAVGGQPVDVKLAPNGRRFYVANQSRNGVSVIAPRSMQEVDFIPTGAGAHGLYVSRDARFLYVANRLAGTISVIRFHDDHVVATWNVGGSPDMLQLSPDGRQLWASNRYDDTISVIDTRTGGVTHTIPVGSEPHGLAYFPAPGRYSIGHNGVYR
jgi:YVTN family beta-propeller protein